MEEEKYLNLVYDTINNKLRESITIKGTFKMLDEEIQVSTVEWVRVDKLRSEIKLHQLLSGKRKKVFVEGVFRIMQTVENGSKGRNFNFWLKDLELRFNDEEENFEILDLGDLIPFRS